MGDVTLVYTTPQTITISPACDAILCGLRSAFRSCWAGSSRGWPARIVFRVGHAQPTKDVFHIGSLKFKEFLEQKAQGKVKVQVFPSSQLGSIKDMIEGLRIGTVQAVVDAPSRLGVYTPLGDLFKLPYLVETRAQGEKAWASPVGQKLLGDMADKSGILVASVAWRGARQITSNREVRTPADMAGLTSADGGLGAAPPA